MTNTFYIIDTEYAGFHHRTFEDLAHDGDRTDILYRSREGAEAVVIDFFTKYGEREINENYDGANICPGQVLAKMQQGDLDIELEVVLAEHVFTYREHGIPRQATRQQGVKFHSRRSSFEVGPYGKNGGIGITFTHEFKITKTVKTTKTVTVDGEEFSKKIEETQLILDWAPLMSRTEEKNIWGERSVTIGPSTETKPIYIQEKKITIRD